MAQPSLAAAGSPIYIGIELGLFKKHGIDLEFVTVNAVTTILQSMQQNSVQLASGGIYTIIQSVQQGAPFQGIVAYGAASLQLCLNSNFAKAKGITPETPLKDMLLAIKGAKLGQNGTGSPTKVPLYYLIRQYANADPSKFITMVALSSVAAVQTALQQGQVDIIVNSPPVCKDAGGMIYATTGLMPDFKNIQYQVIYGLQSWISSNPDAARGVADAIAEGDAYIVNNPSKAATIIHDKYFPTSSAAAFQDDFANLYSKILPVDGRMSVEMWQQANIVMLQSGFVTAVPSSAEGGMWTNQYLSGTPAASPSAS